MTRSRGSFPALGSIVEHTYILAYNEDTSLLDHALREEGFTPIVLRPSYTARELTYSRTIRCLLNHDSAWRRASTHNGLTLIVESDFVPCEGFGGLPIPFAPAAHHGAAWAFLYGGGPRIFKRYADGSLQGHAACPVAYLISQQVAIWLVEYTREELARHGDLTRYSLWDTQFQWHLMGKGAICFMPWRQYGEHGGLSNPEHQRAGVGVAKRNPALARFGICANHRADVLWRPLKFLPQYAHGNRGVLWRARAEAKLIGWLKLFGGRVVVQNGPFALGQRLRLNFACLLRLCSPF
jgi:hypothetical protein